MKFMKKNIALNFVLLFFSVVIALAILEAVLRVTQAEVAKLPETPKSDWALLRERVWTEHHPELGWYHQKNKKAVLVGDGYEVEIQTNSQGFRGTREYEKVKRKSKNRILFLGDSFVFGFGVENEETLVARLEQKDENLEVLNLGVPGYGIDQMLVMYRTIAKDYETDYVFIGVFPEDFWRATRSFADTGHAKPYFSLLPNGELELHNMPVPPKYSLNTHQFPDLVHRGPVESFLMKSVLYRMLKRGLTRLGKNLRLTDPDTTEEWVLGRAILSELIREVQESGATPVLVILPPERWVRDPGKTSLHKSILRFAKRENVDFIDLSPHFVEAVGEGDITDYYIQGDWHWTVKGNQLAADVIDQKLTDQGMILKKQAA